MESYEDIINRFKNKTNKPKKKFKYSILITKLLLSIIFLFSSLIYIKLGDDNKDFYKKTFMTNSLSFNKINSVYEKYFGEVMPSINTEEYVFNNTLDYTEVKEHLDGEKLTVSPSSLVSNLSGGLVVFTGEKEGYGSVVIIQGNDGYDIWYGNLTNINVNLYDYIEKETILGQTVNEYLYLVIKKDNNFYSYEDYKN